MYAFMLEPALIASSSLRYCAWILEAVSFELDLLRITIHLPCMIPKLFLSQIEFRVASLSCIMSEGSRAGQPNEVS